MPIQIQTAKVYYAPTKNRRYLTREAAIKNETLAIIRKKHPTICEQNEYNQDGRLVYPGEFWNWEELPSSGKLYRRMRRLVAKSILDYPSMDESLKKYGYGNSKCVCGKIANMEGYTHGGGVYREHFKCGCGESWAIDSHKGDSRNMPELKE